MRRMAKRLEYVVVRDSHDLGLDKGMRAYVVRSKDGKMDLDVPLLDMRIVDVAILHPDLKLVTAKTKGCAWTAAIDVRAES